MPLILGFAIATVGILPPGLINMTAAKVSVIDGRNEAISFARLVYAKDNRIEEYVDWVGTIEFADVKRATLDSTLYSAAFDNYTLSNCDNAISGFQSYLKKFQKYKLMQPCKN